MITNISGIALPHPSLWNFRLLCHRCRLFCSSTHIHRLADQLIIKQRKKISWIKGKLQLVREQIFFLLCVVFPDGSIFPFRDLQYLFRLYEKRAQFKTERQKTVLFSLCWPFAIGVILEKLESWAERKNSPCISQSGGTSLDILVNSGISGCRPNAATHPLNHITIQLSQQTVLNKRTNIAEKLQ